MGSMVKGLRLVATALVIAGVLTGCGAKKSAVAPVQQPQRGGILREGLVRASSVDPAKATTLSERVVADELYDGLTTWDPNTLEAKPALAASWEQSADQLHWTFHLRGDAKAANGEPVTSADVKASLQHVARKSVASPVGDVLAPVVGYDEFANDDAAGDLPGIVAVDPTTVRFDLTQAHADWPLVFGNPDFGILHYEGDGSTMTTGPFALGARDSDNALTLLRASDSSAFLDRIQITFFDDVEAAYAAFDAGDEDWAPTPSDKVDEAGRKYGRSLYQGSLRSLYLSFNLANPKFADERFREAIVHAIDRPDVASKLNPVGATVLNGVVVDTVPGSQSGGCAEKCTYDPSKAKDLLKQVFPDPTQIPPIKIDIAAADAPIAAPAAQRIVSDLAVVGIAATIHPTPVDQFGSVTVAPDRELFQTSWSANDPSFGAFLPPLFDSASPSNVSAFKDPKIDDQMHQAEGNNDPFGRLRGMQAAEREIMGSVPIVPLAEFPLRSVKSVIVNGMNPLPTGNFDATRVWLNLPLPPGETTTTTRKSH